MPSTLKRVQVLLRPQVLAIAQKLADKDGLSLSKTCALLIEQALEQNELLDKSSLTPNYVVETSATKVEKEPETVVDASISPEDIALLKKLKLLKELGL